LKNSFNLPLTVESKVAVATFEMKDKFLNDLEFSEEEARAIKSCLQAALVEFALTNAGKLLHKKSVLERI